ncbi:MAG: DDE-type integrase/transposase/recombinase, partial [Candidatus Acidiferrum sp.]
MRLPFERAFRIPPGRAPRSSCALTRLADITYIRLKKEFVYLAVVLDAFSREVVRWALDRTLAARLPIATLEQALAQRQPPPDLVHHSDRGVQYARGDYAQILQQHQMIPSMSR